MDVMASNNAVAGSTIAALAALHELYPEMTSKAITVNYVIMILDSDVPFFSKIISTSQGGENLLIGSWDKATMDNENGTRGMIIHLDDSKVLVDDTPDYLVMSISKVLEQILVTFEFPNHPCPCEKCKREPGSVKFDVDHDLVCNRAKEICDSIAVEDVMMGDVPVVIGTAW